MRLLFATISVLVGLGALLMAFGGNGFFSGASPLRFGLIPVGLICLVGGIRLIRGGTDPRPECTPDFMVLAAGGASLLLGLGACVGVALGWPESHLGALFGLAIVQSIVALALVLRGFVRGINATLPFYSGFIVFVLMLVFLGTILFVGFQPDTPDPTLGASTVGGM